MDNPLRIFFEVKTNIINLSLGPGRIKKTAAIYFSQTLSLFGAQADIFDLQELSTLFLEAEALISMYIIEMSLIAARSLRCLF